MKTFILSESDIRSIINGRDVIKQDGNSKILIRQSYVKDVVAPIISDKFEVHYGIGRAFKALSDGINRGIKEDDNY